MMSFKYEIRYSSTDSVLSSLLLYIIKWFIYFFWFIIIFFFLFLLLKVPSITNYFIFDCHNYFFIFLMYILYTYIYIYIYIHTYKRWLLKQFKQLSQVFFQMFLSNCFQVIHKMFVL